ncbi:probable glucan 1,3-beta-glucosidase A isoform X2 [Phoenix dactylifera]|uniref:Probable glucan 1,3-beta-glucosidase A isoform X2 n=1 Tax=Phoenix dactylifera TaxID=42345 RepID=A0A8B7BF07_PHODC|nr:probable glucan 1,3-beta-glucosidase A isoform X2 [Phoenix dactylifera]
MPIMTCLHYWIWNKLGGKKDFFFASAEMGRWAFCVLILLWILFPLANSSVDGLDKVRGVNLGGWLVVEGWIKPSLFDGIPNRDMLDGTQVQFKSVTLQKYVSVDGGGGMNVTVDRDVASSWETFRLWRVSDREFQFRCFGGQFLTSSEGDPISATVTSPALNETFYIERNDTRVHIKLLGGNYVQATMNNQLTANYRGVPGWDDNAATFEMTIAANNLLGDYQLANGYGHDKAKEVLMKHQRSFITAGDFAFLSRNGINTVRIPVGWWIAQDPYPPAPFIGGSLVALDGAFSWAQVYNLKCIIDLHAAPGSQNGMEHSASRDGSVGWPSPDYISQTLDVIDFLSARYANHPALLGIELLNEPSAASVPLDVLVSYYMRGYQIVRNYSSEAYVIICQRIGNADPMELYQANIGDSNIVVDLHYYNLFDPYFDNMNAMENIQFIYESRVPQLQSLDSANGPLVYIGEWVNEWSVTNASQIQYQMYGSAQLQAYDAASFGWSYWTLKNDRIHWDFEWNIKNKYLLLGSSPMKTPNNFVWLTVACGVLLCALSGMT